MPRKNLLAGALALALLPSFAGADGELLDVTLADLEAARRVHPAELEADGRLAAARRALARSTGAVPGGPVLSLAAGPRRLGDGGTEADLQVGVELPLAPSGPEQRALASALERAKVQLPAAARAEARRDLAAAYVEAWRAQAVAASRAEDLETVERWLAAARRRVEAGADPAYEATLVAGERERAALELDRARAALAAARVALAAHAELPAGQLRLAAPEVEAAGADCVGEGALLLAASVRAELAAAEAGLALRAEGARWALAGDLAREGDEEVARFGLAYRFAPRAERPALDAQRATDIAAVRRAAELESAGLAARAAAARARLSATPAGADEREVAAALAAFAARLAEGKSLPSEVLPSRRQLLAAREAAIDSRAERALAAAELAALCLPPNAGAQP